MKTRQVGKMVLQASLVITLASVLATPQMGLAQTGGITKTPITESEFTCFEKEENAFLHNSTWGQSIACKTSFEDSYASQKPFNTHETQFFDRTEVAQFTDVVAAGRSSVGKRILFFLPDRFLDLVDMITLGIGLGERIGLDLHITRWASLGAYVEGVIGLYWFYNRNLTAPSPTYALYSAAGPYQAYAIGFYGAGTGWTRGEPGSGKKRFTKSGRFSKFDEMVWDGWTDPYGVGFGWWLELHPIEIADFVTGLVTLGFVDISRDDFANPNKTSMKAGLPRPRY